MELVLTSLFRWEPTQSLKLSANADYYMGEPKITDVTIRVIPTEASILSALNAGTIGMGNHYRSTNRTSGQEKFEDVQDPALSYYALQLNTKVAPFNDKNVRLAMQCAIDRQELINTALLGQGQVTGPITSPAFRSDVNDRPCPKQDIAKAKEYLAAAESPQVLLSRHW